MSSARIEDQLKSKTNIASEAEESKSVQSNESEPLSGVSKRTTVIPELNYNFCERLNQSAVNLFRKASSYTQKSAGKAYSFGSEALWSFAEWVVQKTDLIHGQTYSNLPHLKGGILGQYPAFRDAKGEKWQTVIDQATVLADKHPSKMCYFWIGHHRALVVASKERSEEILHTFKKSLHGGDSLGIFSVFLGEDNLFSLRFDDPRYEKQRAFYVRRFLAPKTLEKLTPQIEAIVKKHVDGITTISNVGEFSVNLALDVVAQTQLGFHDFTDNDKRQLSQFIEIVVPKLVVNTVKLPWEKNEVTPIVLKGREFFRTLLEKNKDFILSEESNSALKEFIEGGCKKMWKKDHKPQKLSRKEMEYILLNDDDLLNLGVTFIVIGHETTANAMKGMLSVIAEPKHHFAQEKLRTFLSEQEEKENKKGENIALGRPKNYAENILFETMRLYTVVPTFKEMAEKDCQLKGNYTLYKGTLVYIPNAFIHRNVKDGNQFDPDRELSYMSKNCGFIPFGLPPRTCPGRDFSLLEARKLLEYLVTRFTLTSEDNVTIKTTKMINLRFDNLMSIKLDPLPHPGKEVEEKPIASLT